MAYRQEFICNTRTDIAFLPTSFDEGCIPIAFVISDNSVWIFNSDGEWVEIQRIYEQR